MISYPCSAGTILTRVLEAGDREAPAVVLLHGLSSRADRWVRNIDALAQAGYRVIAPDLPGHGFADKNPDDDHSVPGYADFLLALLDSLEVSRAALVGTSFGGHVVATAALKQPDRFDHLMLIGSTGFTRSTLERVQSFRDWIMNLTPASHRPRLEKVFSVPGLVTDEMVAEDVLINTSPGAAACFDRVLSYMATEFNQHLIDESLQGLPERMRLFLFWGEEDTSVPVHIGQAAHQSLPRSRFACAKGLNHTPYYEDPQLFNTTLLKFLKDDLGTLHNSGVTLS